MNSVCTLMFVSGVPIDFKIVLMTLMLALMKVYFSLLYAE